MRAAGEHNPLRDYLRAIIRSRHLVGSFGAYAKAALAQVIKRFSKDLEQAELLDSK